MDEVNSLVEELKRFDNPEGYEMGYETVKKGLATVIQKLVQHGEAALDRLHALLFNEETWSCLFALEVLKEIRSPKSIPFLVEFIRKNEEADDYWENCEEAMRALTAIGEPAVEPLLREVKADFEKRRYFVYLVNALTEIKDERVYAFMAETIEDYLANTEKYRGWFYLELFVYDFGVQGKKEVLPLLKRLLTMDLSERERIEVVDAIKYLEDPEGYERETREWVEKFKPTLSFITRQKVGRNDPCPCGSGKKYKKCCWPKTFGVG
jgi:HEAT repeat protein